MPITDVTIHISIELKDPQLDRVRAFFDGMEKMIRAIQDREMRTGSNGHKTVKIPTAINKA